MEADLTDRGGGTDEDRNCNHRLRDPPFSIHLLQVPWEVPIGVGRRLDGGGAQPTEGATEVDATIQGVGKVGRGLPDLRKNLLGSGLGDSSVWVGDVGYDTAHWEGFGQIPSQGGPHADGTATLEGEVW